MSDTIENGAQPPEGNAEPRSAAGNAGPKSADQEISLSKANLAKRLDRATRTARDETLSEVFELLGVESREQLTALAEERRKSEPEMERMRKEMAKLQTQQEALFAERNELAKWREESSIALALDAALDELGKPRTKDGKEIPPIEVHGRDQIKKLLRPDVGFVDGKVHTLKDGSPDTRPVADLVAGFLNENKHFVRVSVAGGTGSAPMSGRVPATDERKAHLTPEGRRAALMRDLGRT